LGKVAKLSGNFIYIKDHYQGTETDLLFILLHEVAHYLFDPQYRLPKGADTAMHALSGLDHRANVLGPNKSQAAPSLDNESDIRQERRASNFAIVTILNDSVIDNAFTTILSTRLCSTEDQSRSSLTRREKRLLITHLSSEYGFTPHAARLAVNSWMR
jgi:Zn-dependent peptidase ImmA (M78 family)